MSLRSTQGTPWLAVGGAAVVALAAGYGIARFTNPSAPAPASEQPREAEPDSAEITVKPQDLATMQIAVGQVGTSAFSAQIQAPGSVTSAPNGEALVTAQAAGTVTRVNKRLGDPVRAGEVIAQVASRDAAAMAADRSVAESKAALARQLLARERNLFEQRVTPRQELEAAQAQVAAANAEAQRARTVASTARVASDGRSLLVVSPLSGRITAESVALGAYVQPDTELFRVTDPRFVQIEAAVPVTDSRRVQPGDRAQIIKPDGSLSEATVRSVTPTLNAETRAATVVLTPLGGATFVPGEAIQVRIFPTAAGLSEIVIPDNAIQTVDGREVVFVRTPNGFRVQAVSVGQRDGAQAVIRSGLTAGQSIAIRNAFLLKAEMKKGGGDEE